MKGKKTKSIGALIVSLIFILVVGIFPMMSAIAIEEDTPINATNFPDANFRALVKQYDENEDGILSAKEKGVYAWRIDAASKNIRNFKGLEHFPDLRVLRCGSNPITELDLTGNPNLENLSCSYCQLTELDLSGNPALRVLTCRNTKITSLDLSNNPALDYLHCPENALTSLDLSSNPNVATLDPDRIEIFAQKYDIEVDNTLRFDLSTLPGSFDVSRATNWEGGTVSGNILTIDASKPDVVKYKYDVTNNLNPSVSLMDVKLNISYEKVDQVTVFFYGAGGVGVMGSATVNKGDNYTLPLNDFVPPAGKEFKAWDVDGTEKAAGDVITVNADTAVTAIWKDKAVEQVTISFDPNGGTGTMDGATVNKGSDYTLPENTFTAPDGKEFKAWLVGDAEKAVGDVITVNADTTVTAVWKDKAVEQVTISFDPNGGTGTMASEIINKGSNYILPENAFTAPDGKEFDAWEVRGKRQD
ncbi:MAG: InlB B-repeat-containing protein, partial [Clostridia bacterium]|nr:InlB B-repeat-containing protein [Clostridia bacterium]